MTSHTSTIDARGKRPAAGGRLLRRPPDRPRPDGFRHGARRSRGRPRPRAVPERTSRSTAPGASPSAPTPTRPTPTATAARRSLARDQELHFTVPLLRPRHRVPRRPAGRAHDERPALLPVAHGGCAARSPSRTANTARVARTSPAPAGPRRSSPRVRLRVPARRGRDLPDGVQHRAPGVGLRDGRDARRRRARAGAARRVLRDRRPRGGSAADRARRRGVARAALARALPARGPRPHRVVPVRVDRKRGARAHGRRAGDRPASAADRGRPLRQRRGRLPGRVLARPLARGFEAPAPRARGHVARRPPARRREPPGPAPRRPRRPRRRASTAVPARSSCAHAARSETRRPSP